MNTACDLCSSTQGLTLTQVRTKASVTVCEKCQNALVSQDFSDHRHWQCLHEAIWNEKTEVKVLCYKILSSLRSEPWAQDLLDQILLEEADLKWAQSSLDNEQSANDTKPTIDSNGAVLLEGDSVTLIKDLEVKGAGFTAKRGTLVKNIRLTSNPEHVDARVNGIQIVLVAKFLKKI